MLHENGLFTFNLLENHFNFVDLHLQFLQRPVWEHMIVQAHEVFKKLSRVVRKVLKICANRLRLIKCFEVKIFVRNIIDLTVACGSKEILV